jgi:hypothetical protein
MPKLRLFVLWIVFVCVPVQGYAAAAMAFCDPGPAGGAAMAGHMAHGARTAHDPPGAQGASVPSSGHHHATRSADDGTPPAALHAAADDGASTADAPHTCGTCAACHAVALTGPLDVAILHGLPPADLAEPILTPTTRVPRVLDRPPRA